MARIEGWRGLAVLFAPQSADLLVARQGDRVGLRASTGQERWWASEADLLKALDRVED